MSLKKFSGDLSSLSATLYDAAGLVFYWLPFYFYWVICWLEGIQVGQAAWMFVIFGVIGAAVMSFWTSVWTIRPLIAWTAAIITAVILDSTVAFIVSSLVATGCVAIRAFNMHRALAAHPVNQRDRACPAVTIADV